jgi:hypothetical protein
MAVYLTSNQVIIFLHVEQLFALYALMGFLDVLNLLPCFFASVTDFVVSDGGLPLLLLLFIQVYCPYATLGYERPTPHL